MTVVVSLMSVLESGFPPLGGSAAPPNTLVSLLMKVLFPHPESAANPMTTVRCSPAEHVITLLPQLLMPDLLLLLVKKTTCFWWKPN